MSLQRILGILCFIQRAHQEKRVQGAPDHNRICQRCGAKRIAPARPRKAKVLNAVS